MKKTTGFLLIGILLLAACGRQSNPETIYVIQTENIYVYITPPPIITSEITENTTSHLDNLLYNIMSDTALLHEINTVIGAPLYFDEDAFWGFPFITLLPNRNVIVAGRTDWAQNLTIFLRPDHSDSDRDWIFEAYDISNDGIVLVEPFSSQGTEQSLPEPTTMRIYHEGIGWHGDWWDGFVFAERELAPDIWAEEAIFYIQEISGIAIRDIWFEGNALHMQESPIESYIAWGPASYRRTLLYLTGASLPGVEHVFITAAPPLPFNWIWAEIGGDWDFEYTGRQVLRGHHWTWTGPSVAEEADKVLGFFEEEFSYQLARLDNDIMYRAGGYARLYYNYLGWVPGRHSDEKFYVIRLGELWPDKEENDGRRVHLYWFYINEDLTTISWRTNEDPETILSLEEWRFTR
ncbi:MAG: hypothetical protein FWC73_11445 [Defluviitaleaceae bacterium]|nr:hypothetical protein [Defluviitaleaceae bacterium]